MRSAYLDNLKVLLVAGVIAVHTSITYGVDGSWYLESLEPAADPVTGALIVPVGIGFLFGMGLFFLIAGKLSAPSLERKGPGRFMRDRLVRLGLPLLFYMFAISPFLAYVDHRYNDDGTQSFGPFVRGELDDFAPGPTWFLEALLLFTAGYALLRARRPRAVDGAPPLTGRLLVKLGIALATISFVTHFAFPIGSEQLHLQLSLFPQYVMLFALGALSGERGWLESVPRALERRCGIVAAAAALALPVVLVAGGFADDDEPFGGGWHWQAAAGSLIEAGLAIGASIWLLGFFRRRLAEQGPRMRWMASGAYPAFVLHPPIVVGLALALDPVGVPAEVKLVTVMALGIALAFAAGRAVTRLPRPALPAPYVSPSRAGPSR
ncbi:MAG TPA: acyltransferase [Thermoleophilaceae bacterium]